MGSVVKPIVEDNYPPCYSGVNALLIYTNIPFVQSQVQKTERQIREEFEKLHVFLRKEEEARIAALREEEQEKKKKLEQKIAALETVIESLTEKIEVLKGGLAS